jgi:hypothetical protein
MGVAAPESNMRPNHTNLLPVCRSAFCLFLQAVLLLRFHWPLLPLADQIYGIPHGEFSMFQHSICHFQLAQRVAWLSREWRKRQDRSASSTSEPYGYSEMPGPAQTVLCAGHLTNGPVACVKRKATRDPWTRARAEYNVGLS